MNRKPTPPSPRIMISAPLGCLISRICLATFLSSAGEKPSKMPTGLRSIRAILLLEEVCQLAAEELAAGLVAVGGHELLHALVAGVGQRLRRVAGRRDRLSDDDLDPFAKPQVLGARQRHGHDRHPSLDGEMGEALLEGHELALGRPVISLGEDGYGPAHLECPVDVPEEGRVAMTLADD